MPFSEEDRILIKHYRIDKKYGVKKLLKEFPEKPWTKGGLEYLIRKLDSTSAVTRKEGSGRPKTVRTADNIDDVNYLILSQEGDEASHSTVREISHCTHISKSSVNRIVDNNLNLKGYPKVNGQKLSPTDQEKRVTRAKRIYVALPSQN